MVKDDTITISSLAKMVRSALSGRRQKNEKLTVFQKILHNKSKGAIKVKKNSTIGV